VTFLDCAGVNVLLATRRRARLEDGWVRVIQATSQARQTILLLGLAEVLGLGHAQ
jgi:anti-anti-sigma regulatory factor